MITSYLLTTLRSLKKRPLFSVINILGLSLGIGLFVLILRFIEFEHSYDKFQAHYDSIYRVELNLDGQGREIAYTQSPMADYLKAEYPEVEVATGLSSSGTHLFRNGEVEVSENMGWYAEPSFFDLFSFPLLEGNQAKALEAPFSVVLSQEMAHRLFGNVPALGQTLKMDDEHPLKVTGIIENAPQNTHLNYNYLISRASCLTLVAEDFGTAWNHWNLSYIRLHPETDLQAFNTKIQDILKTTIGPEFPSLVYAKPMSHFHFHSNVIGQPGGRGDLSQVRLYTAIAIFILLIACINFMNLTTAQATRRMKEVGLRKTLGAARMDLARQFLGESVVMALMATVLGLLWAALGLPLLNEIMGRDMPLSSLFSAVYLAQIMGIGLVTGLLSGSYPAFMLSAYRPAVILRSAARSQSGGAGVRKALVVFQFAISMVLILGTLVIQKQTAFMQNQDLGYDRTQILTTDVSPASDAERSRYQSLTRVWATLPGVRDVSISMFTPGFNGSSTVITNWEGAPDGQSLYVQTNRIDTAYLAVYGIPLAEGRNFRQTGGADANTCIINETAAEAFGWDQPVGKRLGNQIEIVGVVRDFHFASLKQPIAPLFLAPLPPPRPDRPRRFTINIKLAGKQRAETQTALMHEFNALFPGQELELEPFEDYFEWMYSDEADTAKTIGFFTGLAIFIACLGLFGLATFTAEQRTKELGVRKVLGATVPQLVQLLLTAFGRWIAVASLLAWPAGFWAMNKWLQTYHYHTNISLDLFVETTVAALCIGMLTVIVQAVKAAVANPVESLKYE